MHEQVVGTRMRVDRQVTELVRRRGRQPTVAELARALGTGEERVLVSLATPWSADEEAGETLGDLVGARPSPGSSWPSVSRILRGAPTRLNALAVAGGS